MIHPLDPLPWLRARIAEGLRDRTIIWARPKFAHFDHAKLQPEATAALCGRYATSWLAAKGTTPQCPDCLELIARVRGEP